MRFLLLMYPNIPDTEWMPDPEAVAAMTSFNEELAKAEVLLALDGLHPPSSGVRVTGAGGEVMVTDGPFADTRESVGGYWLIDVASKEEAVEWARRCPAVLGPATAGGYDGAAPVIEVRQVFELEDFSPELRAAAGLPDGGAA